MTLFVMLPEVISRLSCLVTHGSCLRVENSTSVTEIYTNLIKEITINQGANYYGLKKLTLKAKQTKNLITYSYFHINKNPVPCQSKCLDATLKQNSPSTQARHHRQKNKKQKPSR